MNKAEKKLEFFFDCSSPWTYLAFKEIEELSISYHVLIFLLIAPCAGDKKVMWVRTPPI